MRLNSLDSTEKKILKFFKERDIDLGPIENNVARKNFVKEELEDLSPLSGEDLELLRIFETGLKGKYNGNIE